MLAAAAIEALNIMEEDPGTVTEHLCFLPDVFLSQGAVTETPFIANLC